MPDPIPFIPGVCSQQAIWDTYVGYLNQAFSITVNVIEEEMGEELSLPGIPAITLPNSPSIFLPGWGQFERPIHLRNTPVPKGYTGNVYPLRQVGKKIDSKLVLPGVPDVLVPAPPVGTVPGVDPSVQLITYINQNLEILFDFLNEQGVDVEPVLIPYVEVCNQEGGLPGEGAGQGASPGQILVNQLVQQNLNNAITSLPAGRSCLPIFNDAVYTFAGSHTATDGCWRFVANALSIFPSPVVITMTSSPETILFEAPSAGTAASEDPYAVSDVFSSGCYCTVVGGETIDIAAKLDVLAFSGDIASVIVRLIAMQVLANGGLALRAQASGSFTATGSLLASGSGTAAVPGSSFFGITTYTDRIVLQAEITQNYSSILPVSSCDVLFSEISNTVTP